MFPKTLFVLVLGASVAFGQFKFKRGKVPRPDAAKMKAMQIPAGAPIALQTAGQGKLKGVLQGVTKDGLSIQPTGGAGALQSIPFDQIVSLKQKGKPKPGQALQTPKALDSSLTSIPEGAPVTFTLADKSQVSGRYAGKTPEGVAVKVPGAGDAMTTRTLPTAQIASVKRPTGKLPGMPGLQSPTMVKKSLSGIPEGSPVTLNMPGGGQLSGKMMGMTADGFSLQTLEGGNVVTKQMTFDQVAGVKPPSPGIRGRIPGLKRPGLQTPEMLKAKAMTLPTGSPLTVRMPDGTKTTGKLMAATNDGLQVQSLQGGELVTQNLGFDQIGSIQPGVPKTASGRAKTISKTVVTMAVTAAITGFISGKIAK